jgi:thiamine biosynthesis lipoprotein
MSKDDRTTPGISRPRGPSRRGVIGGLATTVFAGGSGAWAGGDPAPLRRSAVAFGTTVSITVVPGPGCDPEAAFAAGIAAIRAVEAAANLFDPTSELSRLERDGRVDRPSAVLRDLMTTALRLAEITDGAFDPTVQPIWRTWSSASAAGRHVAETDLAAAVARTGWRHLRVADDRVSFDRPGMAATLNGIAQGYACDRVVDALAARGVGAALVDSGEFGARGRPSAARSWAVGIADPRDAARFVARTALDDGRFLATSADSETYWTADFTEHHIVDPGSGHSPGELAEVTVAAPSGAMADGLSTAAMVLGEEKSRRLFRRLGGIDALFVRKDGRVGTTDAKVFTPEPRGDGG